MKEGSAGLPPAASNVSPHPQPESLLPQVLRSLLSDLE